MCSTLIMSNEDSNCSSSKAPPGTIAGQYWVVRAYVPSQPIHQGPVTLALKMYVTSVNGYTVHRNIWARVDLYCHTLPFVSLFNCGTALWPYNPQCPVNSFNTTDIWTTFICIDLDLLGSFLMTLNLRSDLCGPLFTFRLFFTINTRNDISHNHPLLPPPPPTTTTLLL